MPGRSRLSIDHTGSYTVGMVAAAAIALYVGSLAPVLADDKFMSIHMDNQKIGSPVAQYWRSMTPNGPVQPDGFMSIYMDNQKLGSPVANFWSLMSQLTCPDPEGTPSQERK